LDKGNVFYGQFFILDYPVGKKQKGCVWEVFKRAWEEIENLGKETI
jgi:hypothetical protein